MRTDRQTDITKEIVAFRNFANAPKNYSTQGHTLYMGWNFNSGNYLFTTDTK